MESRQRLLPRLFFDVILPSTIAALVLVLALCVQQTHGMREQADAAVMLRMERLAGDLAGNPSPQDTLDRALHEGVDEHGRKHRHEAQRQKRDDQQRVGPGGVGTPQGEPQPE